MYSLTKPNNELTFATFGYNISDLSKNSHQKIIVVCDNCQRVISREKRNLLAKHKCQSVIGKTKRCFKCSTWKDLNLFNKSPNESGGVAKLCRSCYNNHESVKKCENKRLLRLKTAIQNEDIEFYIKRRTLTLKSHCKRHNIKFDLDKEFLYNMWKKQDGYCFYTNLKMSNNFKQEGFQSWDGPSLDRLIPENGYVKDNIVWCIFGVNSFKQSLSYKDFMDQLSKIRWRQD